MSRAPVVRLVFTHAVAIAFLAGAARAQMIPLEDLRETAADVTFLGVTDAKFGSPSAPFAYFESYLNVLVENPDPMGGGSCSADAFQISQFFPAAISVSGGTGGSWNVHSGDYSALSYAYFKFRVDTCFEYQLDAWLDPGDLGERRIAVGAAGTGLAYQDVQTSELHETGRLPAGQYELEGKSYIISSQESTAGPVYSIIWIVTPCQTTLIASHPADRSVACGNPATFSVVPTAPAPPGLTYQWRRNLVPLGNSAHTSGVTTPTLTIANACTADTGYYDVVLSDGTVVEPSRLARLSVTATTAVAGRVGDGSRFSIELVGPNPFRGPTSFRYAAPTPRHARVAIHDVSGARVRMLLNGMVHGTGTLAWDGTTGSGARAPAGIYFLRVDAGALHESRRLVLVR